MEACQNSRGKFDRLRRHAEEMIQHKATLEITSPADMLELIHELKIHQVELEIQNEELKRAQQDLSELHLKYERLYEFAPCGYITLNAKGIITDVNLTGVKLLGVPRKYLLRFGLSQYIAKGWQDTYLGALKTAAKTGEDQSVELLLEKEGDSSLWVRAGIRADRDETDAAFQWCVVLTDISREKEAVTALSQNEAHFRILFENTPIAYQTLDADGNILQVNTAWEHMLGYAKKDVIGRCFSEFILPEMRDCYKKHFPKKKSLDEILGPEIVLLKRNGEQLLAAHKGKTRVDSFGHMTQTHCVLMDITSQRKAEQERQRLEDRLRQAHKMETLGTLAGGIAHDFNNILSIIIGNYELIKEELPDCSPLMENLEQIRSASVRATDVVRQLLTFARRSDTQKKPMNLAAVVSDSLKLIRSTIPANISIQHHLSQNVATIFGNSTQMNQLIINLCANAADAMLPKGGRLTIRVENVSVEVAEVPLTRILKSGPHVQLVIKDTGCGIDAQTLEHIFEPYFTTKPFGKGTGIGLAVVHGIVEQHKGEIFVESEVGKGATFKILLPEFQGEVEEKADGVVSLPKGKEKILFVDDETSIVNVTKARLTALGYHVTCTTDPRKALDKVKADPSAFDLVITDMAMPHMTGDVLSSQLLRLRPDLPIILCTGYSEVINEEKVRSIGIAGFLMKPTQMPEFAATVRKTLDKGK